MEDAITGAGFHELETYISRRQNTVVHFIVIRPILDLCLAEERRLGSKVSKRCWEQDIINLERMLMAAW